jgi:hypothetical protein
MPSSFHNKRVALFAFSIISGEKLYPHFGGNIFGINALYH